MTPKLRFPEFTDEWQVNRLNIFLEFVSSGKSSTISDGETYNIYGSTGVIGKSSHFDYSGDKLLIARVGANAGAIYRVDGEYKVSDNTLILGLSPNIDTSFAQFLLNKLNLNRLVFGSGQPLVTGGQLKKLKVVTPQKPEQEKIAEFLGRVDNKLTSIQAEVTAMYDYKKGVMQALFSGRLRFKDDNGNPYPSWDEKKMSDVFEEVTDRVGKSNVETYSITAGHGFVSQAEKFGKDISGMQNQRYTLLEVGHFAYNKGNSKQYAYGCVYVNNEGKAIAVPNVFISFKLRDNAMTVNFYQELFKGHYLDRHLRRIISSGARMDGLLNVNKKSFFEIKIPVPDTREQKKIAEFLVGLDDKIKLKEAELAKAKEFKKALLQRMFI